MTDKVAGPDGSELSEGLGRAAEALHAAVCQAVALLNRSTEVVRIAEGREAHQILRLALADYADGYMNAPVTPRELEAVAAKHRSKPHVKTAAEMRHDAKHDTSCVGAFARARPCKA